MFCKFNMFDMNTQVYSIQENENTVPLFKGTADEIANLMSAEYQTGKYEKIVLAGPYGETLEQKIRTYSKTNYNCEDVKIEVIE